MIWQDIRDHWVNIILCVVVLAALLFAFSLDDPKFYGPGNTCPPPNQPTPCN